MDRKISRGVIIIGFILIMGALASSAYNIMNESKIYSELGSYDFMIRTGGRLQEPDDETQGYPLGHSVYTPGNLTMDTIEEFREFSIFYQLVLGIEMLENGTQLQVPVPEFYGSEYDIYLNLSTAIVAETPEGVTTMSLDNIVNFHLTSNTSQRVIIPKGISMSIINSGTKVEFLYFETETENYQWGLTSDLVLTQRAYQIDVNESMNVSLVSEWTALFVSPGTITTSYSGEGIVGTFTIDRNVDSAFKLSGEFKCYFESKAVTIQASWYPVFEIPVTGAAFATICIVLLYEHKRRRSIIDGSIEPM